MPKSNEEKNLNKIQRLLSFMDEDALTKEEFVRYFQIVIDLIKKLQQSNEDVVKEALDLLVKKFNLLEEDTIKKLNYNINQITKIVTKKKLDYDVNKISEGVKENVINEINKVKKQVENRLEEYENKKEEAGIKEARLIEEVTAKATELVKQEIKPLIPEMSELENNIPVLGKQIRNALELLQGDDRLEMSAIKDLTESLEKLEKRIMEEVKKKVVVTGSGGGAQNGGRIVKSYDLSASLNGVTKTFSLPAMWRVISVFSSSFPNAFRQTVDYTYDAGSHQITFTNEVDAATALSAGITITIIYAE